MHDILVIGGGINGIGIARDAAGRGLDVVLCEKDDLASHTSSSSSKLIHGGLRYLEHYEFRLVRESLGERETLLRTAPHIIWPVRIVLPVEPGMRPSWLLRIGLFLYDNLAKRSILPGTKTLNLRNSNQGAALQEKLRKGFEYSDCWADDARLVALNAVDAKERGAEILTRTECIALERHPEHWTATLRTQSGEERKVDAKLLVNAAGPWVERILDRFDRVDESAAVRLVKGSHIVTKKLYEGSHSYIFQSADGRIIFAMPYEGEFTLIGTTDVPMDAPDATVEISDWEIDYLCGAVNGYFHKQISKSDIVWSYAGVRPLSDDQAESASVVTRDYVFDLEGGQGSFAPVLSIFGGKLTTYRKLAAHAMEKIGKFFPSMGEGWTRSSPLPGGNFEFDEIDELIESYMAAYPWLAEKTLRRMVRSYGTLIPTILGNAQSLADMGRDFGAGLYQKEVDYLRANEFAKSHEDILWRRSKLGLHMTDNQIAAFAKAFDEFPDKD